MTQAREALGNFQLDHAQVNILTSEKWHTSYVASAAFPRAEFLSVHAEPFQSQRSGQRLQPLKGKTVHSSISNG